MPRRQVLYLHDNLLETWETFTSLGVLDRILHLTLFNNPCIHLPQYRKFMLESLPSLLALDFHIATQEERLGIINPDPEKSKIWIHLGKSLIHKMTFFFCQMTLFGSQGADAKSIFLFPVFSLKVAGECHKPAYNFFPLLLKINIFCNKNN